MSEVLADNPEKVAHRNCTECGMKKPWTHANFAREPGGTRLQLICRPCKQQVRTRNKLAKMERLALEHFLTKASKGGNDIPHSAEMLEGVVSLFGGAHGLASAMLKQYYDAAPGGRIRSQMLEMITRLTLKNTELGGAKKPLELYTQEELEEEMAKTVRQVVYIDGESHAVPALPDTESIAAVQSGLICSGQDARTAAGNTEPANGGVAALFPDTAAESLPRGYGERNPSHRG
jgi:hypothetical protein